MDRINGKDTADIGQSRRGFKDQDAVKGIAGTELQAAWLNSLQEEILKVIEGAGIKPDAADWGQLAAAIGKSALPPFSWNINWMAVKGMDTVSPPDNGQEGDIYLIPAGASGAWAEKSGQLAIAQKTGWLFARPKDGHGIGLPNGEAYIRQSGVYQQIARNLLDLKDIDNAGAAKPRAILTRSSSGGTFLSPQEAFAGVKVPVDDVDGLVNQSLGNFGYVKLPGGLIVQWGDFTAQTTESINANGVYESVPFRVLWPVSFPKKIFQFICGNTTDVGGVGQQEQTWGFGYDNGGATVAVACRAPYEYLTASYFVIGN